MNMNKQLLLLAMILLPMVASAEEAVVDGIIYNLISKDNIYTAEVKYFDYKGYIKIPASISYQGIEYKVTYIGEKAFYNCAQLVSVTLPETLDSIGNNAFENCTGIASIIIPDNVKSIGSDCFYNCSKLTSLNIPNSIISIGDCAFSCCYALENLVVGSGVTIINHGTFSYCRNLSSITLPENLKSIGDDAFRDCGQLVEIELPSGLETVGKEAFCNCKWLSSIIFPENITDIGSNAFKETAWVNNLPDGLTYIGKIAYIYKESSYGNHDVVVKEGTLKIASNAFMDCNSIVSVSLPNSLVSIGESAFYGCTKLVTINIPSSIETINANTFKNCISLSAIEFPEGMKTIGYETFSGCISLQVLTFPNSVTYIGDASFWGCKNLTSVILPEGIKRIGYAFEGCSKLASIIIPNSVNLIAMYAFQGCSSLKTVVIGEGVEKIESSAFRNCGLEEVKVLAHIPPKTSGDAFTNYNIPLYVPTSSVEIYKVTEPWNNFMSIDGLEGGDTPEPPEPQKCEKPTISYNSGQLKFASATDGVEFVSEITDSDIKKNYEATVNLTATYNISVYATKADYENSETATATLCWIDKEPTTEGITDGVVQIASKAVLIQSEGGILKVEGVDDGTQVSVYTPDGKQAGSAVSRNGAVLIGTSIQPGNTAIVKIGDRAVKVIVR